MALFNFKPPKKNGKKKVIKPVFGYRPPVKKKVSKNNMNWGQAKAKYPKLNPLGDADKDGVQNWLDCKPFNKKEQGILHSIGSAINRAADSAVDAISRRLPEPHEESRGMQQVRDEIDQQRQRSMQKLDDDEARTAKWKRSMGRDEEEIEDDARVNKVVRKHFGY